MGGSSKEDEDIVSSLMKIRVYENIISELRTDIKINGIWLRVMKVLILF